MAPNEMLTGLLSVLAASTLAASQSTPLNVPGNVPAGASKPVGASFPSFAIQGSSFPAYTGSKAQPNIFSRNLIEGIQNRTGGPLVVRVGGTNTDASKYDPSQTEPITPKQTNGGVGAQFTFGPSFFEGFQNWPNTHFMYDVPFVHKNREVALGQAKAAVQNIGLDRLAALEVGNEPDFYGGNRPAGYGPAEYVTEWHNWTDWLAGELNLPVARSFQALTLGAHHEGGKWSAPAALQAGLTSNGRVRGISLHHYETTNTKDKIQTNLMSHGFMKRGVDVYKSEIEYIHDNNPFLDVVFGESGRYSPDGSASSTDNSQGIFGTALWTADYLMYLMTQNVTRVNMQLGQAFGYVAWHPVEFNGAQPGVRAPYFGHLLAADFMGGSPNFRVKEIETGDDTLAAYAGYENGKLKRVAIINYKVWNGSGTRPSRNFSVQVPAGTGSGTVSLLTSPYGATSDGYFYWAGLAFSYPNNGVGTVQPGIPQPKKVNAANGRISVDVGSSQAILLELN